MRTVAQVSVLPGKGLSVELLCEISLREAPKIPRFYRRTGGFGSRDWSLYVEDTCINCFAMTVHESVRTAPGTGLAGRHGPTLKLHQSEVFIFAKIAGI